MTAQNEPWRLPVSRHTLNRRLATQLIIAGSGLVIRDDTIDPIRLDTDKGARLLREIQRYKERGFETRTMAEHLGPVVSLNDRQQKHFKSLTISSATAENISLDIMSRFHFAASELPYGGESVMAPAYPDLDEIDWGSRTMKAAPLGGGLTLYLEARRCYGHDTAVQLSFKANCFGGQGIFSLSRDECRAFAKTIARNTADPPWRFVYRRTDSIWATPAGEGLMRLAWQARTSAERHTGSLRFRPDHLKLLANKIDAWASR